MNKILTSRKLEYLYLLYIKRDTFVRQMELVKLFGVTKVTVSCLMSNLEEEGYIEKNERKNVKITQKGIDEIRDYADDIEKITEWLRADYELEMPQVCVEAARFCFTMSKSTIARIIGEFENRKMSVSEYRTEDIIPGAYNIYFTVMQKDESKISMGNIGFVKPCRLVCDERGARLVLHASEIRYRFLRGKLARLKYLDREGKFVIAENDGDIYNIPADAFTLTERGDGITVRVHIKALSSCGVLHMPESEAVIRFRMDKGMFDTEIAAARNRN